MPRARMRSPASPMKSASGRLRRIASISPAPSWSPDSSPTMSAKRSGRSAMSVDARAGFSPARKRPARRKASIVSSRPTRIARPASAATPARPAAAARSAVCGPMVGRSWRPSCCGFRHLTSTPPASRNGPVAAELRDALEHRVGALVVLDCGHAAIRRRPRPGRCRGLPTSSAASRRRFDVRGRFRAIPRPSSIPSGSARSGAIASGLTTRMPFSSMIAATPASRLPSRLAHQLEDAGDELHRAEIGPERAVVRAVRDRADQHRLAAAVLLCQPEHPPNLAPSHHMHRRRCERAPAPPRRRSRKRPARARRGAPPP